MLHCESQRVYNLIEYTFEHFTRDAALKHFSQLLNKCLTREMAAYRILDIQVVRITNQSELAEIDAALESELREVSRHFEKVLELISDKTAPDYGNSAKDSISALEAYAKAKGNGNDFSDKLRSIGKHIGLHRALQTSIVHLDGSSWDRSG